VTPARPLLPLAVLLLASCAGAPSPGVPAATRAEWAERAQGFFACRSYARVNEFLDRIRPLPPRRPRSGGGGAYQLPGRPMVFDDLFPLDGTFDLYVVWNGKGPEDGARSLEVVGFGDLKPRIPPEYYEPVLALHRSPTPRDAWSVDPVLLVRAVNALRALGPRARAALAAYVELDRGLSFEERRKYAIDVYRILPVLQLLGPSPRAFGVGGAGGLADPGPALWPLFPLAVEQGVPFLVQTEYLAAGPGEDVSKRLGAALEVRAEPLEPAGNPAEAAEALMASPRWGALLEASDPWNPKQTARGAKDLKMLVRTQALAALASVYRPPDDFVPKNCCEDPSEGAWRQVLEDVRALGVRWDPGRQDFVRSR